MHVFTDQMIGLSYECESIFRRLETHFGDKLVVDKVMAVLVRDVYDSVNPDDLALGSEVAIKRYSYHLAEIYRNMPIPMERCFFSISATSPLGH